MPILYPILLISASFEIIFFFLHGGTQAVFLTFTISTVVSIVRIITSFYPEIGAVRVGKEVRIHPGEGFCAFDSFRVVAIFGVVAFFKRVEHSVDGDFALFVSLKSVNVDFLKEEKDDKNTDKDNTDDEFENSEALFAIHG